MTKTEVTYFKKFGCPYCNALETKAIVPMREKMDLDKHNVDMWGKARERWKTLCRRNLGKRATPLLEIKGKLIFADKRESPENEAKRMRKEMKRAMEEETIPEGGPFMRNYCSDIWIQ